MPNSKILGSAMAGGVRWAQEITVTVDIEYSEKCSEADVDFPRGTPSCAV